MMAFYIFADNNAVTCCWWWWKYTREMKWTE